MNSLEGPSAPLTAQHPFPSLTKPSPLHQALKVGLVDNPLQMAT